MALLAILLPMGLHAESRVLEEPTVYDLRMSESLFDAVPLQLTDDIHFDPGFVAKRVPEGLGPLKERLARSRPKTCHTQGLAISDEHIFISCSFYADTLKRIRAYAARSLLLRAPRDDVFAGQGEVRWEVVDLTGQHEDDRFDPPVTRVLGHPSGLILDHERDGLWVATAVYDPGTYALLRLIRWDRAPAPVALLPPLHVGDHIGTVGLFLHGSVSMGIDWGSGIHLFDLKTRKARFLESGFDVDYQDCDVWNERSIVCGGYQSKEVEEDGVGWGIQTGRLDLLTLEGDSWEAYRVKKGESFSARSIDGNPAPALELGRGKSRYQEGKGDIVASMNRYGDYQTPLPLTNNGMALSPDRKYVYFLPADLPGARLVRFTLVSP